MIGRLERDGWLTVRHGKAHRRGTTVAQRRPQRGERHRAPRQSSPARLRLRLLELRLLISPPTRGPPWERLVADVRDLLTGHGSLPETAAAFAAFDWRPITRLTVASGNPLFTLIPNGFRLLRAHGAPLSPKSRRLAPPRGASTPPCWKVPSVGRGPPPETITRDVMAPSIEIGGLCGGPGRGPRPAEVSDETEQG